MLTWTKSKSNTSKNTTWPKTRKQKTNKKTIINLLISWIFPPLAQILAHVYFGISGDTSDSFASQGTIKVTLLRCLGLMSAGPSIAGHCWTKRYLTSALLICLEESENKHVWVAHALKIDQRFCSVQLSFVLDSWRLFHQLDFLRSTAPKLTCPLKKGHFERKGK